MLDYNSEMKMKKIYIIILTIVLGACNDELDIKPQASLDESLVLTTDQNVQSALLGAYDGLSGYNVTVPGSVGDLWGGGLFLYSELLGANSEISWVGTFNEGREIAGKNILVNNGFVENEWTGGYYTINICNNVLSALDVVDAADRTQIEGEALFIRGSVYFELVRYFALPYSAGNTSSNLGVPIVLKPTRGVSDEDKVSRNTVEAVYLQVIDDLTKAEAKLSETNGVYATKTAAAAILSRVYLAMGDYAKARDAANRVIESELYELTETYEAAFNNAENSTEDIFAMQVNSQDGDNNMITYWSIPEFGGRDGDVQIEDKHLELYEPDDDRLNLFYEGAGAIRSGKWKHQFTNVFVVRLAEMYLTRAEANFRLGTATGATPVDDINMIRFRAGLDRFDLDGDEDDPTVEEEDQTPRVYVPLLTVTLNQILMERKLELAFEGSAIHDIKRLKGTTADGYAYDADELVFPIPFREMTVNKNLVQNDGYGDL
jgi:tetratricopeptide (TPR) repeat protein